jgi:hypothetical protein
MVDYQPLRHNNWKLPEPESEEEKEQAAPEPIVVDFVYNELEERNAKTIVVKISFQLPL